MEPDPGGQPAFDLDAFCRQQTPVFFGSAVNNFGVQEILNRWSTGRRRRSRAMPAPVVKPPRHRSPASCSRSRPTWIPKHRDRIAFFRICSAATARA